MHIPLPAMRAYNHDTRYTGSSMYVFLFGLVGARPQHRVLVLLHVRKMQLRMRTISNTKTEEGGG